MLNIKLISVKNSLQYRPTDSIFPANLFPEYTSPYPFNNITTMSSVEYKICKCCMDDIFLVENYEM